MNLDEVFAGSTLKASDVAGREVPLTIRGYEVKDFDDGKKLALSFNETDKELICNKTNANTIGDMYGPTIEGWVGKQIVLIQSQTDFNGRQVACIRVKVGVLAMQPQELPGTPNRVADPSDTGSTPF